MNRLLMFFAVVAMLIPLTVLSQDEQEKTTLRPTELKREIGYNIEAIENSNYAPHLWKYIKVKEEKKGSEALQGPTGGGLEELLYIAKFMAQGKCDQIQDNALVELCVLLNTDDCDSASLPWKGEFCKGVQKAEPDLMTAAMENTESEGTRGWCLYLLAIYYGFKSNSLQVCEQYMKDIAIDDKDVPLCDRLGCQILFSENDTEVLQGVIRDLAILSLSLKEEDPNLCNQIGNERIKEACHGSSIKTLKDIFW